MIAKPNIIIIHGTTGCPEENWYPWLKEEVHALGWDASVPTFPTPEGQSLGTWKAAFNKQLGSVRPNMILIGHSIGTAFILNLLEESAEPVTATYMVAGFIGKLGPVPPYDHVARHLPGSPVIGSDEHARLGQSLLS